MSTAAKVPAWAKAVASAEVGQQRGRYFEKDGNYTVQVKNLQIIETMEKGPAFVGEFEVLKCSNPEVSPGETLSWYRSVLQKPSQADLKRFALLLAKVAGDEIDTEDTQAVMAYLLSMVNEGQPHAGRILSLRVDTKPQVKDPSRRFTHTIWSEQ
jgi:hypothetical protein